MDEPIVMNLADAQNHPAFVYRSETGEEPYASLLAVPVRRAGHTLGVIGLGKIGSLVADAAIRLGMNVLGYDPHITVEAAWSLPSQVRRANSVDEILKTSDFVSLHVPLVEKTKHLVNTKNIDHFRSGAVLLMVILFFSRGLWGLVERLTALGQRP